MKNKILPLAFGFLISFSAFSQDTTHHSAARKTTVNQNNQAALNKESSYAYPGKTSKAAVKKHMYRDTGLGSSTKKYKTYKKNDYGAGAVTTSPK